MSETRLPKSTVGLIKAVFALIRAQSRFVWRIYFPTIALLALLLVTGTANWVSLVRRTAASDISFWFVAIPVGAMIIGAVLLFVVLAVIWHRTILRPGAPSAPFRVLASYGWRAIMVWFFVGLTIVFLTFLSTVFAANVFGAEASPAQTPTAAILLSTAVINVPAVWLFFRLGVILPAAAVDDTPMSLAESAIITHAYALPLLGFSIFVVGVELALDLLSTLLAGASGLQSAIGFVFSAVPLLFGFACLNLLFGEAELEKGGQ